MKLQCKELIMVGLGIKNDPDIIDGNHLRWFFDPVLGFPKYGFKLYRRVCKDYKKVCWPGEPQPTIAPDALTNPWAPYIGTHPSPWKSDGITFEFEQGIRVNDKGIILPYKGAIRINLPERSNRVELNIIAPSISSRSTGLKVSICFAERWIEKIVWNLYEGLNQIFISADAIDSVKIRILQRRVQGRVSLPYFILSNICCYPLEDGEEWRLVRDFHLPITHNNYPFKHNYSSDWEAAKSGLDKNKKEKVEAEYDPKIFEDEMKPYLEELVKYSPFPQYIRKKEEKIYIKDGDLEKSLNEQKFPEKLRHTFKMNGVFLSEDVSVKKENNGWEITDNKKEKDKKFIIKKDAVGLYIEGKTIKLSPLQTILFSAFDPVSAQMLGLYYVDTAELPDACDYKIVGCWTKEGCEEKYLNDEEKLKDMYFIDLSSIELDNSLKSFKKYGFYFLSNQEIKKNYPIEINGYLRITCPRLTSMVGINLLQLPVMLTEPIIIRINKGDGLFEATSIPFELFYNKPIKIFEDHKNGIQSIEIFGNFYLTEFSYGEMDYAWVTFNIKKEKKEKIDAPTGLKAYLLTGKNVVIEKNKSEEIIRFPATVGLKWNLSLLKVVEGIKVENIHLLNVKGEDVHFFYKIQRQLLGKGETPGAILNEKFEFINNEQPVFIPRLLKEGETEELPKFSSDWPPQTAEEKKKGIPPIFYIDAGDKNGDGVIERPLEKDTWYVYRIIGIDIFGRHSKESEPIKVKVTEKLPPPPPPLMISAKFIDPSDPFLQEEEKELGKKCFRIKWIWPEKFKIQAPDIKKFRVYFHKSLINVLEAEVLNVKDCGGESLKGNIEKNTNGLSIILKGILDIEINKFKGRWLRDASTYFKISSNTQGIPDNEKLFTKFTLEVEPYKINGEIIKPIEGLCVVDVDYSEIEIKLPQPENIQENVFKGETLRQKNKNFRVMSSHACNNTDILKLTVHNLELPPREIPQLCKGTLSVSSPYNPFFIDYSRPENWKANNWDGILTEVEFKEKEWIIDEETKELIKFFDIYIPEEKIPEQGLKLVPTTQEPIVSGFIGVSSVNESGKESTVSPLISVFAVFREKPKTPSKPNPDISELWTTIPDYYGISHFEVKLPVTENSYFYQVYRTMDKTLMLVDISEHKDDGYHEISDEISNEIKDDIKNLDEKIFAWKNAKKEQKQRRLKELEKTYLSLRNDTWQFLASLPKNEKAFVPVSKLLDPNDPKNWEDSNNMFFKDSIDGKGRGSYFYRIGVMDKAGNMSSLSPATPPVCVPDVIPPKPPTITKVLSGDRKGIICWRRNTDPGMVRYEIYRTDKKHHSVDIRLMGEPIAKIDGDAEGMPIRAQIIKNSGDLDVAFIPNAKLIKEVYEINENGEMVPEKNYFGGFKSLICQVAVDEGNVEVQYTDIQDKAFTKVLKAFKGQVKLGIETGEKPIKSITNIEGIEGISSGEIVLQGENIPSLRGKRMAISYIDIKGDQQVVQRIPYEMEYIDNDLEAGIYYYRIVAVREGVIGKDTNGEIKKLELSSYPSKLITIKTFDFTPPNKPTIEKAEWIKIDDIPAVILKWSTSQAGIKCIVERRLESEEFWIPVSQWLKPDWDETQKIWLWTFYDKTVNKDKTYFYRLKLINTSGKATFSEELELKKEE